MNPPIGNTRFSLASLIAFVVVVAVLCAFVKDKYIGIRGTAFVLLIFVLLWSAVKGTCEQRGRRAFWAGFALLGWPYAVIVSVQETRLIKTHVVQFPFRLAYQSPLGGWMSENPHLAAAEFLMIELLASTFIVGILGGMLARQMFRKSIGSEPEKLTKAER
jgi:cobalamin synthase